MSVKLLFHLFFNKLNHNMNDLNVNLLDAVCVTKVWHSDLDIGTTRHFAAILARQCKRLHAVSLSGFNRF